MTDFHCLSNDVLSHLFHFVPFVDRLLNCERTCHRWNTAISYSDVSRVNLAQFHKILFESRYSRHLYILSRGQYNDGAADGHFVREAPCNLNLRPQLLEKLFEEAVFPRVRDLRVLTLHHPWLTCLVTSRFLARISEFYAHSLEELYLPSARLVIPLGHSGGLDVEHMFNATMAVIFPHLRILRAPKMEFASLMAGEVFVVPPNIRPLSIRALEIFINQGCPVLQELDLSGLKARSFSFFLRLNLPYLRKIDVSNTDADNHFLGTLLRNSPRLTHLNISSTRITYLQPLIESAVVLNVKSLKIEGLRIQDDAFANVCRSCTNLELLWIRNCPLLTNFDAVTEHLRFLTNFAVSHPAFSEHHLKDLAAHGLLKRIQVESSDSVTDDAVRALAQCRALKEASFSGCRHVSAAPFDSILSSCPALEILDASETNVDNHILRIAGSNSTSLRTLKICNCRLIDETGWQLLLRARRIHFARDCSPPLPLTVAYGQMKAVSEGVEEGLNTVCVTLQYTGWIPLQGSQALLMLEAPR